jgi:hypothetical protein
VKRDKGDETTSIYLGYYGWGNAAKDSVRAVDGFERRRGFRRAACVDLRVSRSFRAAAFRDTRLSRLSGGRDIGACGNWGIGGSWEAEGALIQIAEPKIGGGLAGSDCGPSSGEPTGDFVLFVFGADAAAGRWFAGV